MKKIFLFAIFLLGASGLSLANFEFAVDKYYKANIEAAYPQFKILAEEGGAKAQMYLSNIYENGMGDIEEDSDLAQFWKEKSFEGLRLLSEQGDPEAQFYYAQYLEDWGEDYDVIESWRKKSFIGFLQRAELGDAYSQSWLSYHYSAGIGVDADEELSKKWEQESANKGDAFSQYWLGLSYIDSEEELSIENTKAIEWLTKAAERGHQDAITDLAGIGISIEPILDTTLMDLQNDNEDPMMEIQKAMKASPGISEQRIGKWYLGLDCNAIDFEVIVLHDEILSRAYQTEQRLISLVEEQYNEYLTQYVKSSNSGDLYMLKDNILISNEYTSLLQDYYFESPMFNELESANFYIPYHLLSCNTINDDIGYITLESDAIEFDKFIYSVKNNCKDNKAIDCLREFIDFADASNNNKLSRAELTRFSRFAVKWLALKGELQLNERVIASSASMALAPALAELILLNYDYNNDDHIDIREITYDLVNIVGGSKLNNKILRGYIEVIDSWSGSRNGMNSLLDSYLR